MGTQKKLQVPISDKLKKSLEKRSEDLGFSSLNEAVRVILQGFANGQITLQLTQTNFMSSIPMIDIETEKRIAESIKN